MSEQERELGPQPLDTVMTELELTNHDLVAASSEGLTHKQVNKGRKGRRITRNIQDKIAVALSVAADKEFHVKELFTYR